MVAAVQGLFNPQAKISEYISSGMIAKEFAGLDWYEDQNIPVLGVEVNRYRFDF